MGLTAKPATTASVGIMKTTGASGLRVERSPSLADVATVRLRKAILSGDLRPGQRLNEADLTAELGISRTPLREALRALARIGLVTTTSTRRSHVAQPSADHLADAALLRAVLEGIAGRLLASRQESDVLSQLDDLMARLREAEDAAQWDSVRELDWRIHEIICARCGNARLLPAWSSVSAILQLHEAAEDCRRSSFGFLSSLLDAMRAGSAEAVETMLRGHILHTTYEMLEIPMLPDVAAYGSPQPD